MQVYASVVVIQTFFHYLKSNLSIDFFPRYLVIERFASSYFLLFLRIWSHGPLISWPISFKVCFRKVFDKKIHIDMILLCCKIISNIEMSYQICLITIFGNMKYSRDIAIFDIILVHSKIMSTWLFCEGYRKHTLVFSSTSFPRQFGLFLKPSRSRLRPKTVSTSKDCQTEEKPRL